MHISNSRQVAIALLMLCNTMICLAEKQIPYTIAKVPWPAGLGNHRAVLKIEQAAEAVYLNLPWRRHDKKPDWKRFIILHEASGDTISNIYRVDVSNEACEIVFGPVNKRGLHHFYYLPFEPQEGYGFFSKNYLRREPVPDTNWLSRNKTTKAARRRKLPKAEPISFESRTAFDSFYPMEVIALVKEKQEYIRENKQSYSLFAEGREYPVRMKDNIPQRWLSFEQPASFFGKAATNEYYVFQIALWASVEDLENVQLEFSSLSNGDRSIPATAFTCFNTNGVDPQGKPFVKQVDVPLGKVQSFWIGVDVAADLPAGSYRGTVSVQPANAPGQEVNVHIEVLDEVLEDRGDSEPWRHSRLRWLNSTAGIDDQPVPPFGPIEFLGGRTYGLSGKTLTLGNKGLPSSITTYGKEILDDPILFVVESDQGSENIGDTENETLLKFEPGVASGAWEQNSEHVVLRGIGVVESDGWLHYNIKLQAKEDLAVDDIRLEIPFRKEMAAYMMGMGLPGQRTPENHQAKWEGQQDSFWIGNVDGGLHCELRGASYSGPLLNLYKPAPPPSWHNEGKGGFRIASEGDVLKAIVYSGSRDLKQEEELEFEFSLLITPVKQLNPESQFTDRYYHNGGDPWPKQSELDAGVKVINLHHANKYNPHINYPFIAVDEMRHFVDHWHEQGMKVKIYYTIRELTNYVPEIWALRSLGDEIIGKGLGGGYPWLIEHFVDDYRHQWYQNIDDVVIDASVLTSTGESRWFNYYIEGLRWLVKNVDIDGLYLDDVSFDRNMLKRIRKVMDQVKPGCLVDLHSNTGFSKGPAIQYTDFFPYVDKLWFGESFQYDEMPPANWLVEVSGIPFGLMGDMLHGGGNPWRGMVYGMTVRHPWTTEGVTCDPRAIWHIWDDFGIAEAKMVGYWDDHPVVKTNHQNVKATAYIREGKTLISVASWAAEAVNVELDIAWNIIHLQESEVVFQAPYIENFQPKRVFEVDEKITLEPGRGWLIIVENNSED